MTPATRRIVLALFALTISVCLALLVTAFRYGAATRSGSQVFTGTTTAPIAQAPADGTTLIADDAVPLAAAPSQGATQADNSGPIYLVAGIVSGVALVYFGLRIWRVDSSILSMSRRQRKK